MTKFKILLSPRTVKCELCRKTIEAKKDFRLTANLGSGNYPHHYHIDCFRKRFGKELDILLNGHNPSRRDMT